MTPLVVDRATAAVALGVSEWTLDRYIADGLLPAVKYPSPKRVGAKSRRVLIAVSDIEAFLAKSRGTK